MRRRRAFSNWASTKVWPGGGLDRGTYALAVYWQEDTGRDRDTLPQYRCRRNEKLLDVPKC